MSKKKFYEETLSDTKKGLSAKLKDRYGPKPPPPAPPPAVAPKKNPLEGVNPELLESYVAKIKQRIADRQAGEDARVAAKDPERLDRARNQALDRKMNQFEEETGTLAPGRTGREEDEEE